MFADSSVPFIVTGPEHTWAVIMLFNERVDMPHLSGGGLSWQISPHSTDFNNFVSIFWEKEAFCVQRRSLRFFTLWKKKVLFVVYNLINNPATSATTVKLILYILLVEAEQIGVHSILG